MILFAAWQEIMVKEPWIVINLVTLHDGKGMDKEEALFKHYNIDKQQVVEPCLE